MLVTEQNVARCLERVDRADRLTMDCETTGLGTWTGDKVVGYAVKAGGEAMYFAFGHGEGKNLPGARKRQLVKAMSGKPIRGFHLRFDIENAHNDGLPQPPVIEDALVAAILMNENEPTHALKRAKNGTPGLAAKYLGPETIASDDLLNETLRDRGLTKGDIWKLPPEQVAVYACDDLHLPDRLLDEIYLPALERWGMSGIFQEYNDYQRCLIDIEIGGLPIDRTLVERALSDGESERAAALASIHEAAGYPLNPQSPKQVSAWLGTPNAQEETVLASKHPCADLLIDYKAIGKRDSTYLSKFLSLADARGVLHPQLSLVPGDDDRGGTRSGRLSCSRPPLQGMPKPETNAVYAPCRQAIRAPEGFSIVEADYSQAEVRVAAHYSQEPALFSIFSEKRDIYQEAATALGITRMQSKILFLAIQYGAGAWKIAQMLGITEQLAWQYRDGWFRRFPRIKRTMYRLSDIATDKHTIKLWSGRWRHFDGERKSSSCKSPYYTAWNALVQGSVAEMVRHAMMRLWPVIRGLGGRMLLQVHDSILFLIPTEKLTVARALIREHMENFPLWDVAPHVDIKSGPTWLDVKEAACS